MAMTMNGQVQLAANRQVVWEKLNDPEVLKSCIPGSEQLDKISDNEFQAIATVKVGPVKARWKGKVRLTDLDPPNSYRISGEGEGGVPYLWHSDKRCTRSNKRCFSDQGKYFGIYSWDMVLSVFKKRNYIFES